jgi:hypothetical protein
MKPASGYFCQCSSPLPSGDKIDNRHNTLELSTYIHQVAWTQISVGDPVEVYTNISDWLFSWYSPTWSVILIPSSVHYTKIWNSYLVHHPEVCITFYMLTSCFRTSKYYVLDICMYYLHCWTWFSSGGIFFFNNSAQRVPQFKYWGLGYLFVWTGVSHRYGFFFVVSPLDASPAPVTFLLAYNPRSSLCYQ